ncbi:MAG: DUF1553 domain-containing protein [Planctomycetes bacterium]|nr:DUF1553 domain-containing protein [Planctomycetota bacterium]
MSRRALPWIAGVLLLPSVVAAQPPHKIEFNRDIRPILSNNCFVCHGPDNNLRKAKLRLDDEKDAHAKVITKGEPLISEMFTRLVTDEPGKKMPPAKSKKQLTKAEIQLIFDWIEQGAKYEPHWSLIAPKKHEVPKVKGSPGNDIDRFIIARLEKEGLKLSDEADPRTLIRRLSFDLTGLPPTPDEVGDFVKEYAGAKREAAYGKVVDRLLASKHFGERMAVHWLDVVRYADTAGYHSDNDRNVWMYRDWVINAFNTNKRFADFAREQIAGDLLPNATNEQKIASGHNRLLQTTEEGGSQAKEYTAKYAADRVRNFSAGWLGLTLGCTECHDHKYDPFTTKEFYKLASFFADIQEVPVGRQPPTPITTKDSQDKIKKFDDDIAAIQKEIATGPKDRGKESQKKLGELQKQRAAYLLTVPSTLITTSGNPRVIRMLKRGNWLDESGEIVAPGVPAALNPLPSPPPGGRGAGGEGGAAVKDKKRATRLDLADWLVASENPLAARVFVNRLWMLYFGHGIVKTADDFGALGAWPTHPELLDWLALDFQASGGDFKRSIKLIVMSSTYRQSSKSSPELRQRDPYNQLVARQGRFRLDAEFVRDNALAISGLLVPKIGGPSVKPYQPAGYWRYLNFPTREWMNDKGESQYRRGLYTWWQRTFLQPSLLAFDASNREECTVERPRSNTPQQALVLLNDPTYVEASRVFAEKIIRASGKTPDRIQTAYRLALQRQATAAEIDILTKLVEKHRTHYEANPKEADALLGVGYRPAAKDIRPTELAAWTSVARTILNLHETITRD